MPSVSDILSIVLGVFGLFYGAFGALRLGVWLDVVLVAAALYLLALRESPLRSATIAG